MKRKILIVDDEADIREVLRFNFTAAGYEAIEAASAEAASNIIENDDISLILLDIMLPGMSGYALAKQLRQEGNTTPIIFLTALGTERNLLEGFKSGGDDYISKPFSVKEVLARVDAVLRRSPEEIRLQNISVNGPLTVDNISKSATIGGEAMDLSHKEFEILSTLAGSPGTCFSRADLIAILWKDSPYVLERTVDVHIARIRKKLGSHREILKNKAGFGYYIDPEYK